ncbi:MAG: caspase family protein [Chitinophagaceae bacterium]
MRLYFNPLNIFLLALCLHTGRVSFCQNGDPFNASLSLELRGGAKAQPGGILYDGDLVTGFMHFDESAWDGKTKFYCYVFHYSDMEAEPLLVYPLGDEEDAIRFPQVGAGGKIITSVNLFEGIISPPFGKDNFVLLMTENPVTGLRMLLMKNSANGSRRQELLKLVKGSKLSDLYQPEYGRVVIKTMQLESRPASEKTGLVKNAAKKNTIFAFNDSAEIFFTPSPQYNIVRDSFPMIEIIDPLFDTITTKGLKVLPAADNKKILIRGIAVDWKRGIDKITINNQPATSFRESSGYFDYLYDLKEGTNTALIHVKNKSGFSKSIRIRFEYQSKKEAKVSKGKDYLFVIGINDYKGWPPLYNASRDARDFKKLMMDEYGFKKDQVAELFDAQATREKIYKQLSKFVDDLQPNDRLLIYFSGHGYYNKKLDMGFWIPSDAPQNAEYQYLSNLDITRMVQKMNAKNIFVIADACYSGQLLRDMQQDNSKDYKSRMVLCSGKLQPVSDGKAGGNSPFATVVLGFLRKRSQQPLLASELIQHVKTSFKETPTQKPVGGAIDEVGDENGDFIFARKTE